MSNHNHRRMVTVPVSGQPGRFRREVQVVPMTAQEVAAREAESSANLNTSAKRLARERLDAYARSLIAADFPTLTVEQLKDIYACFVDAARSAKLVRAAAVYVRAKQLHQSIGGMDTATAEAFDPAMAGGWPS